MLKCKPGMRITAGFKSPRTCKRCRISLALKDIMCYEISCKVVLAQKIIK